MPPPLTTRDIADRLGIDPSRVRKLAAHYGIGQKIGRDWIFTEREYERLRTHSTGKAGRPRVYKPDTELD